MSPSFLWLFFGDNYSYFVLDTKNRLAVVVDSADPLVVEVGMRNKEQMTSERDGEAGLVCVCVCPCAWMHTCMHDLCSLSHRMWSRNMALS